MIRSMNIQPMYNTRTMHYNAEICCMMVCMYMILFNINN